MSDSCMNEGDGTSCHGSLTVTFSQMGTRLVRCARHQARRDAVEEHIRELESPFAPAWFDPADAGESWDNPDSGWDD